MKEDKIEEKEWMKKIINNIINNTYNTDLNYTYLKQLNLFIMFKYSSIFKVYEYELEWINILE